MNTLNEQCTCGHRETVHIMGVCAVLKCTCVRRDLERTMRDDGTINLPAPFGPGVRV